MLVLKLPMPQVDLEGYRDSSFNCALNQWIGMTE
jgi:hypothetical protein